MINLTSDDFISAFKNLAQSLDFSTLRRSPDEPPRAHNIGENLKSLEQILAFSLKWKLAFNSFPIQSELDNMNPSQKTHLKEALENFYHQLTISEKNYYRRKFKDTLPEFAYMLSKKSNWATRFIFIFPANEKNLDNAAQENLAFFMNLLTMLSKLLDFVPS